MNPDFEKFEQLRRLLVLKRYEQPPPGYFNDFSSQVIARIQAGEQLNETAGADPMFWEIPWLERLWAALQTKPIVAGAFGAAVCTVLISGLVLSEKPDPSTRAAVEYFDPFQASPQSPVSVAQPTAVWSTEPVNLAPEGHHSLFDDIRKEQAIPAAWTLPNGN